MAKRRFEALEESDDEIIEDVEEDDVNEIPLFSKDHPSKRQETDDQDSDEDTVDPPIFSKDHPAKFNKGDLNKDDFNKVSPPKKKSYEMKEIEKSSRVFDTKVIDFKPSKPKQAKDSKQKDSKQKDTKPKNNNETRNAPRKRSTFNDSKSTYAMEIISYRGDLFKAVIGHLTVLVNEAKIIFNPSGIEIYAVDSSTIAAILVKFPRENFEKYYCPETFEFGIDVANFNKLLNPIKHYESLSFVITMCENRIPKLTLVMTHDEKNKKRKSTMYTITMEPHSYDNMTDFNDKNSMTFPSAEFRTHIADVMQQASTVTLKSDYKNFYFCVSGDYSKTVIELKPTQSSSSAPTQTETKNDDDSDDVMEPNLVKSNIDDDDADENKDSAEEDETNNEDEDAEEETLVDPDDPTEGKTYPVERSYILRYINGFSRATQLSPTINLSFNERGAMVMHMSTAMATITYCLSDVNKTDD